MVQFLENLVNNSTGLYKHYIHDLGDPRVRNWFPISSPIPTFVILGIYFILIYMILPRFMRNRKPYSLHNVIQYYNIIQIMSCAVLVYKIITPFSEPAYVWKCEEFSYSETPTSLKRLKLSYYFYFIKLAELLETIFFTLRKKFNQVSVLHVYHHVTTLTLAWFFAKYFAGGMVSFSMMANSIVHIFMYSYYFVTSLGPKWQKKIAKWKSTITTLQMTQLAILIIHSSQVIFNKNCKLPNLTFYIYAPNVGIILYMFGTFYADNYKDSKKKIK